MQVVFGEEPGGRRRKAIEKWHPNNATRTWRTLMRDFPRVVIYVSVEGIPDGFLPVIFTRKGDAP